MLAPPSFVQRSKELRLGLDLLAAPIHVPQLMRAERGDGRPVLLVTGFGGTDLSLSPLRAALRRLGHDARPVGLGRVGDDVDTLFPMVGERAARLADETERPVAIVGWSIGGVLAREAARDDPEAIRQVVTIGTPVEGGPSYTALAGRYAEEQLAAVRARIAERNETPIAVPVTAIWSPNDGVVAPAACIDRHTPDVEHVEVSSTHIGMGLDPRVWAIVADRLAAGR